MKNNNIASQHRITKVKPNLENKGDWKYALLAFFIVMLPVYGIYFAYQNWYMGDYIIQRQWISSVQEETNITYCDNCLWIEFYEGCNRYLIYYFENEHEINPRFESGSVVNINWKTIEGKTYIRGIQNAKKYRSKCYA